MRSATRRLVLLALVAVFCTFWRARSDEDVVIAQTRKPVMITRIFTGPDGLSHAEETELKLDARGLAEFKATGVEFSSTPGAAGASNGWHTGPKRQLVITLSGRSEVEVADGKKIPAGPGHINLIEDTTGKGHITRNFEDRVVVTIPLE